MKKDELIVEFKQIIEQSGFHIYLDDAHKDGRLGILLPEVDKLYHTPEQLDNGEVAPVSRQVQAMLEKGDQLSGKCKYALLMANVSKAYTSEGLLPLHPLNYGVLSAGVADRISHQLQMPKDYNELAVMFCRYHRLMENPEKMRDKEVFDLAVKCNELNLRDEFVGCSLVHLECKAQQTDDPARSRVLAFKSHERLKAVFADVNKGNGADYARAALEDYRNRRGW